MSRPSDVLFKFVIPNQQYPEFALRQRDFRLNFCINNSSESLPSIVPIYKPVQLDSQLDMVSFRSLYLNILFQLCLY